MNDTYTTDGEQYGIPADPRMVSALGRVMWHFLSLEETAVARLYEVGTSRDLRAAWDQMAGGKEMSLKLALTELRKKGAPTTVLNALEAGIEAVGVARSEYRNALSHAALFTAGYDADGTYRTGLTPTGGSLIGDPSELHAEAHRIEDCSAQLAAARTAINKVLVRA